MGRKRVVLIAGAVVALVGLVLLGRPRSNGSNGEVVAAAIPDPDDVREIQATIVEGYKAGYVAMVTHDVSGFPSVFVDDPAVPLTRGQRGQLRDWLGRAAEGAGYLTYSVAAYHNSERLTRLSEEAWAKVEAAGRDYITPEDYLTPDELRQIEASGGPMPPPPPAVSQPTMSPEEYAERKWENIRFESVVITGDRATVAYDDHWFLHRDTLVRRDGNGTLPAASGSAQAGGSDLLLKEVPPNVAWE